MYELQIYSSPLIRSLMTGLGIIVSHNIKNSKANKVCYAIFCIII